LYRLLSEKNQYFSKVMKEEREREAERDFLFIQARDPTAGDAVTIVHCMSCRFSDRSKETATFNLASFRKTPSGRIKKTFSRKKNQATSGSHIKGHARPRERACAAAGASTGAGPAARAGDGEGHDGYWMHSMGSMSRLAE
jgi:hypothetical protein